MIWGMAAGASVLLAANFAVRKKCTADWGQGLRAALLFNLVLGLLGGGLTAALGGIRVTVSVYSAILAFGVSACTAAYTVLGFRMMARGGLTQYTIFLMTGGMAVPYLFGAVVLHEPLSGGPLAGIAVLCGAVAVTQGRSGAAHGCTMLGIAVFLLNGATSVLSKLHSISAAAVPAADFVVLTNGAKVILCGVLLLLLRRDSAPPVRMTVPMLLWAAAAALTDCGAYVLLLRCAAALPATVLYPFNTGTTLLLTTAADRVVFRASIPRRTVIGLGLCAAGVALFWV